MDVLTAIRSRRSTGLVEEKPVPRETIEQVLEAGTWAPSHHRTEPWRFFVMTGNGRKRLGEALRTIQAKKLEDAADETAQKKLDAAYNKAFRSPVVIAAAVVPSDNPKALMQEEHGAVYAAIQNMLLAAHALGLGAYWRTGAPAYDPLMKETFGLPESGEILGFLYLGYPKRDVPDGKRRPVSDVTEWIEE